MNQQQFTPEEVLANYLGVTQLLSGEKPTSITVTPDFYTQYVQAVQHRADVYNLTPGFKDGKVMFNGVEIIKKVKIEVA